MEKQLAGVAATLLAEVPGRIDVLQRLWREDRDDLCELRRNAVNTSGAVTQFFGFPPDVSSAPALSNAALVEAIVFCSINGNGPEGKQLAQQRVIGADQLRIVADLLQ